LMANPKLYAELFKLQAAGYQWLIIELFIITFPPGALLQSVPIYL
jgi:hypothetical protein